MIRERLLRHAWAAIAALLLIASSWGGSAHAAGSNPQGGEPAVANAPNPPPNFRQLDPWLDYRRQARVPALPMEARIFYRHGLQAYQSNTEDDALRLVRGAIELDPTFLAARLTLFRWELTRDPSQALAQASGIVGLVRRDFATQWSLVTNAAYLLVNAWLFAIILTGLLLLMAHNSEVRHGIRERLALWSTPASSRTWSWVLMVAPFLLGYGIALPVFAGLGLLWPVLKNRERAVWVLMFVSLASLPFVAQGFDRLALPLRAESPLAAVLPLGSEPWTAERDETIARLSMTQPRDPYARFGAGWMALGRHDGVAAEAAYHDVLRAWPEDDRVLNDLGTALIQQGRQREALATYQRAVRANPKNAIAYFNLSQAQLMEFDFDQANRSLARATSLDFDGVREYKSQPARNGALDPIPDWLAPGRQWESLRSPWAAGPLALPPQWQDRMEWSPRRFGWIVLIVGILSLLLGRRLNRALPLYRCVNCDRVVCRRCAERRRAQAVCHGCARVARGAASENFARILLARERERSTRLLRSARLVLTLAVPGSGLIANRHVWRALLLLLMTAIVLTVPPGATWPYAARARVAMPSNPWNLEMLIPLALIYALSLWGHFTEQAIIKHRLATATRPIRTRPRVSTRVQDEGSTEEAA